MSGQRSNLETDEADSLTLPVPSSVVNKSAACLAERFLIKSNGRMFFVKAGEIDWIEAAGNYVSLHVADKAYLLRESMRGIEGQLDSNRFLRVHRSAIIHINRVRDVQSLPSGRHEAIFVPGARATLGRSGIERLKPAILELTQTTSA
jgi:two-component system LytT family response regulator